ncbi:MAG: glutaconyl-CoA decarboxylase subunit beta, partial [Clostridiales bacterium]|nr:glutaconyl-CoA decarboxylase subunit beta [Clostridiales bacterium]
MDVVSTLKTLWNSSGFLNMGIPHLIMIIIALALMYLAIRRKFEPLLLLPIAFGILLANLPITGIFADPVYVDGKLETPGGL